MNKKWAALGVSLGVLGGGVAGFVATSASPSASAESRPVPRADATADDGHEDRLAEILAPLVEDGTINQTQADAVIAALDEAMPDGRGHRGDGPMGGGFGGFGGLDEIVEGLGLDLDEIMTSLRDGTTIAELAEQQGVDLENVIDAATTALKEHLDEQVADGDLTQAEADGKLAEATGSITALVEGDLELPFGGMGPFGGRGHHGGPFGHHDDDDGSETNSDPSTSTTLG